MRVVVVLFLLILGTGVAEAQPRNPLYGEPSDFLGIWQNVEGRRTQVLRIVIKPDYGARVRVAIFGLRNGVPAVFGEYSGKFYVAKYPKDREEDNSAIHVKVDRDFVRGHVLLRFNGRGEIVAHALLSYPDRGDTYTVERFAAAEGEGYGDYGDDYPPRRRRPYWRSY
jgi:hypothetical protein